MNIHSMLVRSLKFRRRMTKRLVVLKFIILKIRFRFIVGLTRTSALMEFYRPFIFKLADDPANPRELEVVAEIRASR